MQSSDDAPKAKIEAAKVALQIAKPAVWGYSLGIGCFAVVTGGIALVVCIFCIFMLVGLLLGWGK